MYVHSLRQTKFYSDKTSVTDIHIHINCYWLFPITAIDTGVYVDIQNKGRRAEGYNVINCMDAQYCSTWTAAFFKLCTSCVYYVNTANINKLQ